MHARLVGGKSKKFARSRRQRRGRVHTGHCGGGPEATRWQGHQRLHLAWGKEGNLAAHGCLYCGDIKDDDANRRDNLTLAATLFICTIVGFGFCDDNLKPKNTADVKRGAHFILLFFFFLLLDRHLDILMPPMQPQPCSSLAGPKHCKYTFLHLPACLYQSPSQCSFHFFCFVRKKQEMI